MRHPDDARLNEYADGRLDPASAADVEAHLARCDACADRVEAIRDLGARLRSLPAGIPPRRDLRPSRPQTEGMPTPAARREGVWHRPWLRAAAVAALLVAGAVGTWLGVGRDGDTAPGRISSPVAMSYARAGDELAAALRPRRAELTPAAARSLETSLATVEAAIRELQGAPVTGEDAVEVARQLEARQRTRLELLRGALDLLEGS